MLLLVNLAFAAEPPPTAAIVADTATRPADDEPTSFRVTIVPGVGLNADPNQVVDGFSVGGIGMAQELHGFDAQLGMSWVDGEMSGFQATFGLAEAGSVDGWQVSSGVAWSRGDVRVLQGAMLSVAEGSVDGVQVGLANLALGDDSEGVQLGLFDLAGGLRGVQGSMVNVAREVHGAQIGLVNVGGDVKGLQLGLVNVAKTSDVSIAPLNFVGDGLHRIDIWTSESAVLSGAIKFGSKNVYTLVGAGQVNTTQPWWTFGGGFGVHLPAGPVWIELDDSVWALAQGLLVAPGATNKLRLQVGFDLLHDHIAPFAGVSVNTWAGDGSVAPRAIGVPESRDPGHHFVSWPGFQVGLSF
ncbi:MAG: hypothetical protein H6738_00920 [Alphaproteobacteria bacterium]|nr:hypothetical protein [Alphaproteobacteria bacterium]MCB9695330.1 hypothetical protein [Alphaproteobacteria bacterium]